VISDLDLACVARTARQLRELGLPTTHLATVGGWGAPHPDPTFSGEAWWTAWRAWNAEAASFDAGWSGFDGLDWDLEGTDDEEAPSATFSPALLRLVANVSARAQAEGFVASAAPPLSLLNSSSSGFSLGRRLFGGVARPHNAYAALLALLRRPLDGTLRMAVSRGYAHPGSPLGGPCLCFPAALQTRVPLGPPGSTSSPCSSTKIGRPSPTRLAAARVPRLRTYSRWCGGSSTAGRCGSARVCVESEARRWRAVAP